MYEEYLRHFSGEITEEIDKYVNEVVFKEARYIFTEKREGEQYAYCTYCNKEFRSRGLKHKSMTKCPYCGGTHKVQSTAYKRTKLEHAASFVFFEKSKVDPLAIVAVEYYVTKNFAIEYKNVKNYYTVLGLTLFKQGESIMLKKNYWNDKWEKRSSVFKIGNGEWFRRYDGFTSLSSIENAVKGTPFQYSTWENYKEEEDMLKFFELYSKYPTIEYLTKCGCETIVREKLGGYKTFGAINWRGKTIFKMLKLTKGEFKEIQKLKIKVTAEFLNSKQVLNKICKLSMKEIDNFRTEVTYYCDDIKGLSKIVNLSKLHKYLVKQKDGKITDFHSAFIAYKDYIDDCIKLKFDIKDEHVIFPKNLYNAHQNTIKQLKIKENKHLDEKIKKIAKDNDKYAFEYKDIFARPARSSLELIEEGQALHHCVANYSKKYAEGKTIILVIRKKSEPDKPYCTMEIINGRIAQVRANYNHDPDAQVQKFIEEFKETKLKNKRGKVA